MAAIERWDPKVHGDLLAAWVRGHGKNPADLFAQIPTTGAVVSRNVAGWVYMTNGPVAFFDQFISDPKGEKGPRRADLCTLIEVLCAMAKEAGHELVAGCPSVKSLTRIAEDQKFYVVRGCDYVMRRL